MIHRFRDWDAITEQIWRPKWVIYKFNDQNDIAMDKFEDSNDWFVSLETRMT
jgi:hypothetical protein